ncbi:anaerobic glycerol-3-phosphate dehydrogenase subunit C [Salisediminibacterium halotolerans]|uniref:Glycerol-3-phosphate dehydrogenase subunit C n=1 Tax=Salisediminibacterium halotolerans TaxID=517425 RepID=A0A1H9V0T1_9BACI|nr:anaerobic glycerol-3-phosphate dehydrogenase subunit C [Salisediminibacterium haloalkalitolerans]SES15380.1 glycerol-3-phosphate dehydrogenase subunit C [Salisediminibacterium haloalkalitolerans]
MHVQGLNDLDYNSCLKCNACTVSCPVSNVTLDFGGPKHLGPELARLTEQQEPIDDKRIELCTLCGTCDAVCPEGVPVSSLTANVKALHAEENGTKFRDFVLSHAEYVGKIASAFAPATNLTMKIKPARKVMQWVMGMHADRQFPLYRFNNFKRRYTKKTAETKRKVAYFTGCYATYNQPDIGDAFVNVMKHNGIDVAVPKQKCCGVPMFANGRMKEGKKNAAYNVGSLLAYVRAGYDVVATCSSCSLSFKKEYLHYLNSAEAEELAQHVYDANEYLRFLKEKGELNEDFGAIGQRAGYFSPCHMKGQGIGNPAMDMLELIPGYEIRDLAADCCGQCGTFGFKEEKYPYSMKMGESMKEAVNELDAEVTVTECGMCKTQLDQLTEKKTMHPIEVLAKAYETV